MASVRTESFCGVIGVESEEVQLLVAELRGLEETAQDEGLHPLAAELTLAKAEAFIELVSRRQRQVTELGQRILLAAMLARARECRDRLRQIGRGDQRG